MEEDEEVLLPRGEEYIFGEEAILGDINYINEILKEKLSIEEYNKVITRISIIKADLREKQQLEKENKDLQKSVDQIYDDYQDIGKMYFNLTEKIENKIEELKEIADEDNLDEFIKIRVLQEILE